MKRTIYRILAIIFIILGIIGTLLPVMPTVPFLLAALYFAADEPRIKNFISSNKLLKKYLESYQGKRPVPLIQKIAALCGLWLSLIISGYFFAEEIHWQAVLVITGLIMSIFILRIKSGKK